MTANNDAKRITSPAGYRLLEEGEVICAGDIYLRESQWLLTNNTGARWNPRGYWPMARRQ